MKLVFVGTGYVGLVSGVMLSHIGHDVTCIDTNESKIKSLQKREVPIYEPGLKEYLNKSIDQGNLHFASSFKDVNGKVDAVFICVGTPSKEDGSANLDNVYEASKDAAYEFPEATIVIKSTTPPGTGKKVREMLRAEKLPNEVASNPEFLSEGNAVNDFLYPDRIVIGTQDDKSLGVLEGIYEQFVDAGYNLVKVSITSAEMVKYASNSFLASKIAFVNEVANLCEKTGADIDDVTRGVGMDPRIGPHFLKAGPGFGGSCFPKDILALQHLSHELDEQCPTLEGVIASNEKRSKDLLQKISSRLGGLSGKLIGVLGLTYKAGTDDIRSSPAIKLIHLLIENGAYICAYDPKGQKNAREELNVDFAYDYREAARGADALVILTEWDQFTKLDLKELSGEMNQKIIFDYRNILDPKAFKDAGFAIYQIGKN